MSEEKKIRESDRIEVWPAKLRGSVVNRINEIKEEGDFKTVNQVMETILESYDNPKKEEKKHLEVIKELTKKNEGLAREIEDLKGILQANELEFSTNRENMSAEYSGLEQKYNSLVADNEKLREEIEVIIKSNELPENHHIIYLSPLEFRVLEYVAARETQNNKKGQVWTINDVICYFVYERFIKNRVNGSMNGIYPGELKKIKETYNLTGEQQ